MSWKSKKNVALQKHKNNMNFIKAIFIIFLVSTLGNIYSQGIKIDFNINNSEDTILFLAHYQGERTYLDDTIFCTNPGKTTFVCDTMPVSGMYIVAGQNMKKLFDFFVDGSDTAIIFNTNQAQIMADMSVVGSEENNNFYNYIQLLHFARIKTDSLTKIVDSLKVLGKTKKIEKIQQKIDKIDVDIRAQIEEIKSGDKSSIFVRFLLAQEDPQILEGVSKEEQIADFRTHYFDNLKLDDAAILRTPIYHNRLAFYVEKLITPQSDSLLKYTIPIIEKSKGDRDTYQYVTWYVTNYAERSKIMGMDAAFVALIDKYFLSGEMDYWLPESAKKEMMVAMKNAIKKYDMPWINVNGPRSFTPGYHRLYDINSTPILYLLDSEKKIVAKNILSEQMIEIIKTEDSKKSE